MGAAIIHEEWHASVKRPIYVRQSICDDLHCKKQRFEKSAVVLILKILFS